MAAVIQRGGRFLVCLRPKEKRHGGLWEFPGGKLGSGESLSQAAQRELEEELGLRFESAGNVLFAADDPGSEFTIEFVPVSATGRPVLHEHDAIRWASLAELDRLNLAPTDAMFVRHLHEITHSEVGRRIQ